MVDLEDSRARRATPRGRRRGGHAPGCRWSHGACSPDSNAAHRAWPAARPASSPAWPLPWKREAPGSAGEGDRWTDVEADVERGPLYIKYAGQPRSAHTRSYASARLQRAETVALVVPEWT
eukprot:scaffold4493_cov390-Prasinococcus_capsulatus_cf.AAC.6